MSGRVIQVLLTDANEWPRHGSNGVYSRYVAELHREAKRRITNYGWAKYRGTPILIITPPSEPKGWNCGTDLAWRVHPDSLTKIFGIYNDDPFFVCRHQIQIGD